MWYKSENGNSQKPEALDTVSSKVYVYVRKNFELVLATEDIPEHWQWMETKIRKEDWDTYATVMEHSDALEDVYVAMAELAELITEG